MTRKARSWVGGLLGRRSGTKPHHHAAPASLPTPIPANINPAGTAPASLVTAAPRVLTSRDGISIPDSFRDYMVLIERGGTVTVYVEQSRSDASTVRSVVTALERRSNLFHTIETKPISMAELDRLRSVHVREETNNTVSFERRVIQLLRTCGELGSNDIQLKQYRQSAGVELRIAGDMTPSIETLSKTDLRHICFALWNMSDPASRNGNYSETMSAGASIVHKLADYGLADLFASIRLQFNSTFLGPEVSIRLQPAGQTARPLEELGLPAPIVIALRQSTSTLGGAVIISGPVGSGKTNLVASTTLDYHSRRPTRKIGTIEDPVEIFIHDRISQWVLTATSTEDRDREYTDLLRRVVRSDYQMVMLQELRDAAAANAYFHAVITGLFGLTTIHTPTAMKIIRRLARWGIDDVILTDPEIMLGLGAVRLVKVLCDCKVPIAKAIRENHRGASHLEEAVARMQRHADLAFPLRDMPVPRIVDGHTRNHEGCEKCRSLSRVEKPSYGIVGRTQLMEYIVPDAHLLELLVNGRTDDANYHARVVLRAPSIQEDAVDRIAAGQTCPVDIEDELGVFKDPKKFQGTRVHTGGLQ